MSASAGTRVRGLLAAVMASLALGASVSSASAQTAGGPPPATEETVVQGVFGAVHADPNDESSRLAPYLETSIANERDPSQSTVISVPAALSERYGGIDSLVNKRVAVRAVAPTRGRDRGSLTATAIDVMGDASKGVSLAVSGTGATSKPVLTVLCKFKDQAAQPVAQDYFDGLAGPNSLMDSYLRQTSYQQINLAGSKVAPATGNWYQLPNNQADYVDDKGKMRYSKLFTECSALAAPQFNLDDFAIIQLAFNTNLVGYSFGGSTGGRRVTWLPPKGWQKGGTVAHELGHAMYQDHTGLAEDYDNKWDVMSGSGSACTPVPTYACMPKHQSAYNKNESGWLNGRIAEVPQLATTTVELQPLDSPGAGPVMARIAPTDPEAKHAYLVEFRRPVGLDVNLPFGGAPGAVIIYETWQELAPTEKDPNHIARRVRLMGFDGAEGARWLPGMVFDREKMFTGNWCDDKDVCTKSKVPEAWDYEIDGIRIRVDSISATKATVTFTQLPRITTLAAGPTTTSSYEVHWADPASTETFFKISYSNNQTSGEVTVPANTTSHTFHNAPAGKDFTVSVQACNSIGCGPGGNPITTGADPLPLKQG